MSSVGNTVLVRILSSLAMYCPTRELYNQYLRCNIEKKNQSSLSRLKRIDLLRPYAHPGEESVPQGILLVSYPIFEKNSEVACIKCSPASGSSV